MPLERLQEKNKPQNKQNRKVFSERMCKKKRKRNTNIDHPQHFYENAYSPANKTSVLTWKNINEKIVCEQQRGGWNLSMMRTNYKLTKRTKT